MGEAHNVLWFDQVGTAYVPRFNVRDSLQLDSANHAYVWTQLDGTVTRFSSISGAFLSRTDVGGNTISIYRRKGANVNATEVRGTFTAAGTTSIESLVYTYGGSASYTPNLTNVLLRRSTDGGVTWSN